MRGVLMDFVWSFTVLISLVFSFLLGVPERAVQSGISGAEEAVRIIISLSGTLCFWSGILRIAEKGGAADACRRILSPLIRHLFPKTRFKNKITMNIIANLFGTGNAATPAGISAMEGMNGENGNSPYPSREMSRFAVMNTASIQLFPTTVISILSSLGAKNPFSIVPLVWISSASALFMALLSQRLLFKKR